MTIVISSCTHTRTSAKILNYLVAFIVTFIFFIGKSMLSKFYRVTAKTFKRPRYGRTSDSLSVSFFRVLFSDAQNQIFSLFLFSFSLRTKIPTKKNSYKVSVFPFRYVGETMKPRSMNSASLDYINA